MKKQEIIDLIQKSIAEKEICRCYFSYDPGYFYCYPNAVNDRFILGQEEDDFLLDGYFIRKISHLEKVEIRMDHCNAINQMIGNTDQIIHPGVDITDWRSIFESLSKMDTYVIIEDSIGDQFSIGVIHFFGKRFPAFLPNGTRSAKIPLVSEHSRAGGREVLHAISAPRADLPSEWRRCGG